jgi:hypothetical protein
MNAAPAPTDRHTLALLAERIGLNETLDALAFAFETPHILRALAAHHRAVAAACEADGDLNDGPGNNVERETKWASLLENLATRLDGRI